MQQAAPRANTDAPAAGAQIPPSQGSYSEPDGHGPRFEKLSSGLRVCIIEDHALPLVSVQLWFKVGSSFDPPTQPGLTHLAVCALQQAPPGRVDTVPATEYRAADTLRDACYFHSAFGVDGAPPGAASEALDRALRREAARFQQSLIDRATIAQVQTAAAAIRRSDPTDSPLGERPLLDAMFPNHPYRFPPEFVGDWAGRADDAVLREHIQRWFTPTSATLFVVGDVSTDATIAAVRQHFAPIEWRDTPRRADFDPPPDERVPAAKGQAPATQPDSPSDVTIAWLTPPFGSFENAAIDVLMQRLCNRVDGPVYRRITAAGWSRPGLQRSAWRNCGVLSLRVTRQRMVARAPDGAPPASVADIVNEELRKAAGDVVDAVELNRARGLASREALDARSGFVPRARLLAEHEIVGGDVLLDAFDAARPAHVSAGDLAFAARLLDATRRVVLEAHRELPPEPAASVPADPEADEWRLIQVAGDRTLAMGLANWAERTRQARNVGAIARIECLPIPGSPLAWITIYGGGAARRDTRLPVRLLSAARQDYLTYRGLRLTVNPQGWSLEGSAPVERLDSLLELAFGAIREGRTAAKRSGEWRIRCTGGVPLDDLEKAIRVTIEP